MRKWAKQYSREQCRHRAHLAAEHVRSSHEVAEIDEKPDDDNDPVDSVATGDVLFDDILLFLFSLFRECTYLVKITMRIVCTF